MIGTRLAHYTITDKIGEGGMGEVYRATDTRLGREVALKLLPVEVSRDPERLARFRREAIALAALDHPNIVTVHSVEETEDRHFLTMGLVEGRALDRDLPAEGFTVKQFLDIAIGVTKAVAAAHDKRIVHRDLKPANIMLTRDRTPKILDFGLARMPVPEQGSAEADAETRVGVTREGVVMGTVPYMSPEQVRGAPVDHRSDLFSLGVIFYEMATGRRPFASDSEAGLAAAIIRDTPESPTRLRAELPPALDGLIHRCLEKSAAARVSSAREILAGLEAIRDGLRNASTGVRASGPAIAVLPFADMSPSRDQDYFCEGMAEEIMNALVHVDGLRVASRTSSFRARQENLDAAAIARTLAVDHTLEGSVRIAGTRMRVTSNLIDLRTGYQVWSERYDREATDVFAVQDEIAAGVVEAVKTQLIAAAPEAPRDRSIPRRERVKDLEAYHLFLKARHFRYTLNDHLNALRTYREVVARDRTVAEAWVGLAEVACLSAWYQLRPLAPAYAESRAALATGEALGGETAETLFVRGMLECTVFSWRASEEPFRRAIELSPDHVPSRCWLGVSLALLGREEQALATLADARERDPLSPYPYGMTSYALLCLGRPDEAEPFSRQAFEFEPDNTLALWTLGVTLKHQGRHDEAVDTLQRAVDVSKRAPFFVGLLGGALAQAGRTDAARAILRELAARPETDEGPPPTLVPEAWMRSALEETEAAWTLLERALTEGQPGTTFTAFRCFGEFHADPRWPQFVRALGLSPS